MLCDSEPAFDGWVVRHEGCATVFDECLTSAEVAFEILHLI
jgi:hypothetical protein